MTKSMAFISILRDNPIIGFGIGLLFMAVMFGAKNIVIYLYSKQQEKK
ncbi:hypothetical protein ACFL0R_02165 [Pseudomonadota bacterium]